MSLNSISPIIMESVARESSDQINIVTATDPGVRATFLTEQIFQNLLEGKHSYIVLPDEIDITIPSKILASKKLAHLTINQSDIHLESHKTKERIKILASLAEIHQNRYELHNLKRLRHQLTEELKSQLIPLNKRITADQSLKEYISHLGSTPRKTIPQYLVNEIYKIELDINFIDDIRLLEGWYEPRFDMITLGIVNAEIFRSHSSYKDASNKAQIIYDTVERILKEFDQLEKELFTGLTANIEKEAVILQHTIERLRELMMTVDLDADPSTIHNKIHAINNELDHLEYFRSPETSTDPDIQRTIVSLQDILSDKDTILRIEKNHKLKRFTPFNLDHPKLSLIQSYIDDLRSMTLDGPFLSVNIVDRYFSIGAMKDDMLNLSQQFRQIKALLADHKFVQFKIKQNQLGLSENLLELLALEDTYHWDQAIISYFQTCLLQLRSSKGQIGKNDRFERISTLENRILKSRIDTIHNRWYDRRSKANQDLKQDNIVLFNHLFRESSQTPSDENGQTFSDFARSYFPVSVISLTSFYNQIDDLHKDSCYIFFESDKLSSKKLQSIVPHSHQISVVSQGLTNLSELQQVLETSHTIIEGPALRSVAPFRLLSQGDRLLQAQALGHALYVSASTFNVYQLKNKAIITLCNDTLNNRILNSLPAQEINILYQNSQNVGDLIDAMIFDDKEIYIVLENNLINDQRLNHITWQLSVINHLRQAQIHVINIDTFELITDFKKHYNDAIDQLLNHPIADHLVEDRIAEVQIHESETIS